jgi:flagellar basal-body rod modification protein FlgD
MTPVSATSASASSTTGSTDPLSSLSSNFGDFLNLLLTQLQNQDPTSPMDANSFTSELVEFSSVEQQINTNTSLGSAHSVNPGGRRNSVVSHPRQASDGAIDSDPLTEWHRHVGLHRTLGGAGLHYRAGCEWQHTLQQANVNAAQGANTWNWNGTNSNGQMLPDGAYTVTVTGGPVGTSPTAVPFTVVGTATGVTTQNDTVNLQLGALSVPFSSVTSVAN